MKMSRPGNLRTLLDDEYREVNSEDVEKENIIIQYFMNGSVQETVFIGKVVKVDKGLFNKAIYFEREGNLIKLNSKDFAGELKFYEKKSD